MTCKQCKKQVKNTFQDKWKHIAEAHPDIMIKNLLPMILNPNLAYETGRRLARGLHGV